MRNNQKKGNNPAHQLTPEWAAFLRASRALAQTARARRHSHAPFSSRGEEAAFDFLDGFTRAARLSRVVSEQAGHNPFNGSGEWRFIAPTPHPDDGRFDFVCGLIRGHCRTPCEKRITRANAGLVG